MPVEGLRGLAILLVLLHNIDAFPDSGLYAGLSAVSYAGWVGVQLFFVISGFLITGGLLDTRGSANYFSGFMMRRVLRILPLYLFALVLFLLVLPRIWHLPEEVLRTYRLQGPLWVFANNWTQPFSGAVYWFPHFWSLAVEEQFYLAWPAVIAFVPVRRLPLVLALLVAVAMLARLALLSAGAPADAPYMFTVCRMDALVLGSGIALAVRSPKWNAILEAWALRLAMAGILLMMAVAAFTGLYDIADPATIVVGYPALSLGFSGVMVLAVTRGANALARHGQRLLSLAPLTALGKYSYGIYVFHLPIKLMLGARLEALLRPLGGLTHVAYLAILMAVSVGVAVLSYYLLERPFLQMKAAFRSRPLQSAPT